MSESWIDTALRQLQEYRPAPLTHGVPAAVYWRLWDYYESKGDRPPADSFHGRVRRRLARELYAAAICPVVRL